MVDSEHVFPELCLGAGAVRGLFLTLFYYVVIILPSIRPVDSIFCVLARNVKGRGSWWIRKRKTVVLIQRTACYILGKCSQRRRGSFRIESTPP